MDQSGIQIGGDQVVSPLMGCGGNRIAEVEWVNVATGTHLVYVSVDPSGVISESNELNNVVEQVILVATHRSFLPRIDQGSSN